MAKKIREPNEHEKLVAYFSKKSISAWSTFHPDLWGNGHEPADMIIKIGRALILVNMTKSKSDFELLCEHNIKQAEERIVEWRGGKPIRGKNEYTSFNIGWDDVDSIAVVSVVDGRNAACAYHDVNKRNFPDKVKLCASITHEVFKELAKRGGGARDLIWSCRAIIGREQASGHFVCELIRSRCIELKNQAMQNVVREPNRLGRAIINGKPVSSFEEFHTVFTELRKVSSETANLFSDLSWRDISEASAFITSVIADIENRESGALVLGVLGDLPRFGLVISTNREAFSKNIISICENARKEGAQFVLSIQLTEIGIVPTCAIFPEYEIKATELELSRS